MDHLIGYQEQLTASLTPLLSDSVHAWISQKLNQLYNSVQPLNDLTLYSAMAKRELGDSRMEQAKPIDALFSPLDIRRWSVADTARLILLISLVRRLPAETESLLTGYYRMGDEAERSSLIRGLILFAPADCLTRLALESGRTNNLSLFSSLSQDNPYPASFYPEQAYNQMVLKCLFLGLAIERVIGLEQRANPDLTRMCVNYVIERENAQRSVPHDIWLAVGPHASPTGEAKMLAYLDNDEMEHRYYCATALGRRLGGNPTLKSPLQARLQVESDPIVQDLLKDILQ